MLAVVVVVLLTCLSAGVTDFGTVLANLRGEWRSTTHEGHGRQANLSAIAIETNAVRQFGDIGFSQAGVEAMIARCRTLHASVNTTFMFMVAHRSSPMRKGCGRCLGHVQHDAMPLWQSAFHQTRIVPNNSQNERYMFGTALRLSALPGLSDRVVVRLGQFRSNRDGGRSTKRCEFMVTDE